MLSSVFTREARLLRALGHPKRLEIVHLLAHAELSASDIQRMTGFPQANLSQHLRELKVAQVLVAVRSGKHILYRLAHPDFTRVTDVLRATGSQHQPKRHETRTSTVRDPVCGMWIEPAAADYQTIYKGATYFFCASGCSRKFAVKPNVYV